LFGAPRSTFISRENPLPADFSAGPAPPRAGTPESTDATDGKPTAAPAPPTRHARRPLSGRAQHPSANKSKFSFPTRACNETLTGNYAAEYRRKTRTPRREVWYKNHLRSCAAHPKRPNAATMNFTAIDSVSI